MESQAKMRINNILVHLNVHLKVQIMAGELRVITVVSEHEE